MENVGKNQEDALKDVAFSEQPVRADLGRLAEMASSEKGTSQMEHFVKHWEYKRANTYRLLSEELGLLSQQRKDITELEQKRQQISEEEESNGPPHNQELPEDHAEEDTVSYWKRRALQSEKAHKASLQRERSLEEKLQKYIKNIQPHTPVEEFSEMLKRADFFLHLILQSAPIVIAHQDTDLRYRYIFNHFPTLADEDVIGKTDEDILSGEGIDEMNKVKREVMARGIPTKREFVFDTPLFGAKTFVTYIEPVFSKSGETVGVNYVAMDVTDQVKTREKIMDIRVREAVQRVKETELSRSPHIAEETTQGKRRLATFCHDIIRSPLSGVLSMAEILATTKLDQEQYQLLQVMLSAVSAVLQLISDIRDLSKLDSGVMELEAVIFRPREVVKHVIHSASPFMKKELTLEASIGDNVPLEVIADMLKIQQILINLISFSCTMEYTQEGKLGINLNIVDKQEPGCEISSSGNSMEPHKGEVVWLRFDVYDTGIGIPEKSLPFLFKRYMEANADHSSKNGGTGLGLAICKQLVDLMGGTLAVVSQENEGSTFTVMLPCTIPAREAPDDGRSSCSV